MVKREAEDRIKFANKSQNRKPARNSRNYKRSAEFAMSFAYTVHTRCHLHPGV